MASHAATLHVLCTRFACLSRSYNRLTGPLPDGLGDLRRLRVLDLSRNGFKGWLNKWVGRLQECQRLSLNHNRFVGSLPDALGRLHSCEYIHLNNNRFDGELVPAIFDSLSPGLRELHLHRNQFFMEPNGGGTASGKTSGKGARVAGGSVGDSEDEEDEEEETRGGKIFAAKKEIEGKFLRCTVLA